MASPLARHSARRRGLSRRGLLVTLALLVSVPAAAWSLWPDLPWSDEESGPMMHTVERGDFVHDITDRGNVESANNTEIRCEVKSKNLAGTTILEIIPEGTMVKAGDVLVKLDSSLLENDRLSQLGICGTSEANLIQARNVHATAVITKREYLEGSYKQAIQAAESELFVAEETLSRAKEYFQYSQRLAAKGYVTSEQLKGDRFAVEKAGKDLDAAKTKLHVLQKVTREKMLLTLDADVKTAEAKLRAAEAAHKLDTEQLALIESQIKKCLITAPEAGQVVYASVTGFRGAKEVIIAAGEQVRERQPIIRLPDPQRMQVIAKISEGKIAMITPEMSTAIRLDAYPDMELTGTVEKVNEFPVPTPWFGSAVKEYETTIRIHQPPPGIRPGLTAEVKIHVERLANVVQVPAQALFEHGNKYYCVVRDGAQWRAREVGIGSTNDKSVVVRQGLDPGQQVVLNSAAYREKVELPALPPDRTLGRIQLAAAREGAEAKSGPGRKDGKPLRLAADKLPSDSEDHTTAAIARMFAQLDRNNDGRLEKEDLPQPMQAHFAAMDANSDGYVDRVEWLASAARFLPRAPRSHQASVKP